MEIHVPYTTEIRQDTGLYNGKLGIWLFLASEVMLFGGLFSSYILLRVGHDSWPHGLLSVPLGTLNTFILIVSSITVVLAWAALKTNQFNRFRSYLGITIVCAVAFLGIKSYEYHDKFTHYQVTLADGKVMTGHIEGSPAFLDLKKLKARKVDSIQFHQDTAHGAGTGGHGAAAMKIETKDIKKLSCFGPWLNTYFAIYFTVTGAHGLHVIGGVVVLLFLWGPGARMWRTEPERLANRVECTGLYWHFVDLVWLLVFPLFYLF